MPIFAPDKQYRRMKPTYYTIRIAIENNGGDHLTEISRFITYLNREGIKATLNVESELVSIE